MRTVERVLWRVYMALAWLYPLLMLFLPLGRLLASMSPVLLYGVALYAVASVGSPWGMILVAVLWLAFGAALLFSARSRLALWSALLPVLLGLVLAVLSRRLFPEALMDLLLIAALLRARPSRKAAPAQQPAGFRPERL